jgi:hypothetical protein
MTAALRGTETGLQFQQALSSEGFEFWCFDRACCRIPSMWAMMAGSLAKDWNDRFERAQVKPRTWRVVVGALILFSKVGHFVTTQGDIMKRLDLWAPVNSEALGYDVASSLMWLLAIWLIASGLQPRQVQLPPEPK